MRVLLVSAADSGGGAFIAARRLHLALLKQGIDSHLLLAKSTLGLPNAVGPSSNPAHTRADLRNYGALPLHWVNRAKPGELRSFNIFPSGLQRTINNFNADLVNLHWVNKEMLSIAEIGKIKAPIMWTLHDMWPLLGSKHYPDMNLQEKKTGLRDLDPWMYRRKQRHWSGKDITFVCPSEWMAEEVARSRHFSGLPRYTIPNPIDLQLYKPLSRKFAKEALGLDMGKRYLLYGSMSGTSDRRKGFHHLRAALSIIDPAQIPDIELLTFGNSAPAQELPAMWRDKVSSLGFLHDDYSLSLAYNAADLFIAPSELDNLPNTIVESLACGTPVVTFSGTGGCSEMIEHKVNGYIAKRFDSEDLAIGTKWLLESGDTLPLREKARNRAQSKYSEKIVAESYASLYESILDPEDKQLHR